MKILAFIFTALVFATATPAAFAGEQSKTCKTLGETEFSPSGLQTNIFQNAAGRVTLVFVQPQASAVVISVADNERNVLYRENVNLDAARQHFDMSKLEKGTYHFTLSANGECFVKSLEIK